LLAALAAAPLEAALTEGKIQQLKLEFQKGRALLESGKPREALAVFSPILAQDPEARGSLVLSGVACNELGQFAEAAPFFERFLKLEPANEIGLIGAIKANQSLGRTQEVERLRGILERERKAGTNKHLANLLSYERETVFLSSGERVSIQEAFDPGPLTPRWTYLLIRNKKEIVRRLELTLAPEKEAAQMRQLQPPGKTGQDLYLFGEPVHDGKGVQSYKIIKVAWELPAYEAARTWALDTLQAGK
jgi:tetratricopeptide (TPR) repeat protein